MTFVRKNMLKDANYRPCCGNGYCSMPRLNEDFVCPRCGFKAKYDPDSAKQYFNKHGKVIPT